MFPPLKKRMGSLQVISKYQCIASEGVTAKHESFPRGSPGTGQVFVRDAERPAGGDFHINDHDAGSQRNMKAARSAKIKAEAGFSQTLSYKVSHNQIN
jgi:hypothetical protein